MIKHKEILENADRSDNQPQIEADKLLTVPEVAAFFGWSLGTTYHKLKELPGVVHLSARCVRVWRSAVVEYARVHTRSSN